jgi:predicted DNA-binding transcriptional regulator AlpA
VPASPFLFLDEVEEISGFCNLNLSRMEKRRRFPRRFQIGLRRIAWHRSHIEDWAADPEAWCRRNADGGR